MSLDVENRTILDTVAEHLSDHNTVAAAVRLLSSYGVLGNGTNERVLVQGVIDDVSAAGGGIVDGGGMTVSVDLAAHPLDPAYKVGVIVPANVELRRVTIKLRANQATDGIVISNGEIQGGATVRGPVFSDVTVDGNGANQTFTHSGLFLRKSHGARIRHCTARNCRGTATSGTDETFHFEVQASSDTEYLSCLAEGTAGSTAAGFSTNVTTGVRYRGCVARGMTVSAGFTTSLSTHITYEQCWSYLNALHGFNNEFSTDCIYSGCVAGGSAVDDAGNTAYPYTQAQSLGNGAHGFNLLGCLRTQVIAPAARKNANSGVAWMTGASGVMVAGALRENLNWGVYVDAASAAGVVMDPLPNVSNNPFGNFGFDGGLSFDDPADPDQPTLPASTVALANPYATDATVYVSGGTVTVISVGGRTTGLTAGAIRWPAGKDLVLTYSAAPTLSVVLG